MTKKFNFTADEIIQAIKDSRGFMSAAAAKLGCSRATLYKQLKKFKTVQAALHEVREKRHDYVESKLLKLIDEGNVAATIFYLKTQCKERGYVERYQQEVTGANGGALRVEYVNDWRHTDDS